MSGRSCAARRSAVPADGGSRRSMPTGCGSIWPAGRGGRTASPSSSRTSSSSCCGRSPPTRAASTPREMLLQALWGGVGLPRAADDRRPRAPPAREARARSPRARVHPHRPRRRLPLPAMRHPIRTVGAQLSLALLLVVAVALGIVYVARRAVAREPAREHASRAVGTCRRRGCARIFRRAVSTTPTCVGTASASDRRAGHPDATTPGHAARRPGLRGWSVVE